MIADGNANSVLFTEATDGISGLNRVRFNVRRLRVGSYWARLIARDAAGNSSAPVTRAFKVVRARKRAGRT